MGKTNCPFLGDKKFRCRRDVDETREQPGFQAKPPRDYHSIAPSQVRVRARHHQEPRSHQPTKLSLTPQWVRRRSACAVCTALILSSNTERSSSAVGRFRSQTMPQVRERSVYRTLPQGVNRAAHNAMTTAVGMERRKAAHPSQAIALG